MQSPKPHTPVPGSVHKKDAANPCTAGAVFIIIITYF